MYWLAMKRATVTIGDELEAAPQAYLAKQEVALSLTAIVQAALREFLARRGFVPSGKPYRIDPAPKGSGRHDVSIRHDEFLAADEPHNSR